jgi:hypothetical protein
MSYQHLRRRWGTTLLALALIAVAGCAAYPTTAYSGYVGSQYYDPYPNYYGYGPRISGWYGNRWGDDWGWRGRRWDDFGWRHRSWRGDDWHHRHGWREHGRDWHHGDGPWVGRR